MIKLLLFFLNPKVSSSDAYELGWLVLSQVSSYFPALGKKIVGYSVYRQWNISLNHNPFYDVHFVVSAFMENVVSGIIFNPETSCQV